MNSNSKFPGKSPKIVKRKFPGPAGLLPEIRNLNIDIRNLEKSYEAADTVFCSQSSVSRFTDKTWGEMKEEFKENRFLFDKYTVEWVINSSKAGLLKNDKVPFLAAKIKKFECNGKNRSVILEDPTGEIEAVISEELYEEVSDLLTVNSVILLKNSSVLLTNSRNKGYIVITSNNLLKIYRYVNDLLSNTDTKGTQGIEIQIATLQEFSLPELVENTKYNVNENLGNIPSCSVSDTSLNCTPALGVVDCGDSEDNSELLRQPPAKRIKTTFKFKQKNTEKNIFEDSENCEPSVFVLSQNNRDIDDVKTILNGVDITDFFDDF